MQASTHPWRSSRRRSGHRRRGRGGCTCAACPGEFGADPARSRLSLTGSGGTISFRHADPYWGRQAWRQARRGALPCLPRSRNRPPIGWAGERTMEIKGQAALVTGGGRNGADVARHLAQAGAKVAVFDLNAEARRAVASEIGGLRSPAYRRDAKSGEEAVVAMRAPPTGHPRPRRQRRRHPDSGASSARTARWRSRSSRR